VVVKTRRWVASLRLTKLLTNAFSKKLDDRDLRQADCSITIGNEKAWSEVAHPRRAYRLPDFDSPGQLMT
jgi:hypothetical protein